MQNLIVLCHRCLTWVETHSDVCPECGSDVCLDHPDPTIDFLTEVMGSSMAVMGPVRVDRTTLPSYGYVIGTSNGFLFLPRLHRRMNGAWEAISSQRLPHWWPFRGDLTSPRFLSWLRRPFGSSGQDLPESQPKTSERTDSLVDQLLDSPGSFFVELRLIQGLSARRRNVKLDRRPMKSITFVDETDDGTLLDLLNAHVAQAVNDKRRLAQ